MHHRAVLVSVYVRLEALLGAAPAHFAHLKGSPTVQNPGLFVDLQNEYV